MKEKNNILNIYIFSFNRGLFLRNSIESVFNCLDSPSITIIDDSSTDKDTKKILNHYSGICEVVVMDKTKKNILGGLYNNMRYAFADARSKGFRYILFLQDDMQVVRKIKEKDFLNIDLFFKENKNSAQLQTTFLKSFLMENDEKLMTIDSSGIAYLRPNNYPGFSGFSAVGLFNVDRFFGLFDRLYDNEYTNNKYAQEKGIQIGIYACPFMMYLPSPPSYRGRKRSFALRFIEWLGGTGFYPYEYMSEDEMIYFIDRDYNKKPYAEIWLNNPAMEKLKIWSFSGGITKLRERGGWRRYVGEVLTWLNRAIK